MRLCLRIYQQNQNPCNTETTEVQVEKQKNLRIQDRTLTQALMYSSMYEEVWVGGVQLVNDETQRQYHLSSNAN